jgi:centrosomal protein CEP104
VVSASDYAVLGRDGLKFERIGYFTFSPNDQSNWQSRELKSVTIDKDGCQFLRLVIHKHHDNRYNLFGQVALVAVRVYGDVEKLAPPSAQRPRF